MSKVVRRAAHRQSNAIRLSARPGIPPTHPVHGPVSLGIAAVETLVSNQDNAYIDDPCTTTMFIRGESASM